MTGYLPYLIEKHGYNSDIIIHWIKKQLNRYYTVIVTANLHEFNLIVKWETAYYVYQKEFAQVLGVHVNFDKLDADNHIMIFKISKDNLRKFDKRWDK